MEPILYFLAGAALAALVFILKGRTATSDIENTWQQRLNDLESRYRLQSEDLRKKEMERAELMAEMGRLRGQQESTMAQHLRDREDLEALRLDYSAVNAQLAHARQQGLAQQEKLEQQKKDLLDISATLRSEFKLMADGILEDKSRRFTEINEEKMKAVLDPLKANLVEFRQKVEETYDKESKQRFSLERELARLMDLNQQLGKEASNLTSALKQNNKVLGNWGEMILESLLENSGLSRGREFFVQEFLRDEAGNTIRDEQGRGLQPDITVVYPDGRRLIIDSKMSLLGYEGYISASDPLEGTRYLKDHCASLKSHIENLSRKEYPRYAGAALDLVILFIPLEPAYFLALKEDPALWKYAFDRKVLLATSTQLLAMLRIVGEFWKVDLQNRNALEIASRAGALYDKFAGFLEVMDQLGSSLGRATESFETARKRLSEGNGNLLKRTEELKKMGAKASRTLPWKTDEN